MSLNVSIRKRLGNFQLDVDFSAPEAEVMAILGASGCGKSMTLRCIAGIEKPDEGLIELNGCVLFDSEKKINLPPQKRKVGYLFQSYALFPNMTVMQNIMTGIAEKGQKRKYKAKEYIEAFFLKGLEYHYPCQLSGGQQQRVALARIFASEPEALLLDEPFSALDSYLRWQVEQELSAVLEKFAGQTLFVSHNRDEVYRLCKYMAILNQGKMELSGEVKQIFETPKTLDALRLTGCKNISKAKKVDANHLLAEDWGIVLHSAEPVSDNLKHVGIRAHYFCEGKRDEINSIFCRIDKTIEDVFEMILMLAPLGNAGEKMGSIRWAMPKAKGQNYKKGQEIYLLFPPESLILLE